VKFRLRGFTLVEILVVFVVLAAVIILSVLNVPVLLAKARDARRKADIDEMGKYIEEYYADSGCYPATLPDCGNPFSLNDKVYIASLPCDPQTGNSYVYVPEISNCPGWFQLYGNLEYTQDSIIDKLGCRNGCGPKCQFNYGTSSTNQKLNPFCQTTATPAPPIPSPTPSFTNLQYVCAPGGGCEVFANPGASGCPNIYLNDPTCQGNTQCSNPKNRCHDSRGKTN
jgi:type II secretory pathway pseudopilin PulG